MKRLLFIPLLALPLLFVSCDGETPTEPATATDASLGVTSQGLVSNTLEFKGSCASGYTGRIRYEYQPGGSTFSIDCPGGTIIRDGSDLIGVRVDYYDFDPSLGSGCLNQIYWTVAAGDFPVRDKCTVNGRLQNGKPIAKTTIKYVKDQ